MKGRRQNASSTAEDAGRKASATGGRTPTCRENHSIRIKQVRLELLPILDLTTKSGCGTVICEPTTQRRMESTPIVPCPALVERTKCETCDDHSARTGRNRTHATETEHRQHYTCLRTGVATDGYDGDIGVGVGVGGRCGPMGNAAAGAQIQFIGEGIIMNAGKREELDTADSKLRIPKSKSNI